MLPMPQASIVAFARACDLDPDGDGLRHALAPGERSPDAAAVIAIDPIERHTDRAGCGVPGRHEITRASTRRGAATSADLSWRISGRRQHLC
jgi:hypothetical protein